MGNLNSMSKIIKNIESGAENIAIKLIANLDDVNVVIPDKNCTLLMLAYEKKCYDVLKYLLNKRANPFIVINDKNLFEIIINNDDINAFDIISTYNDNFSISKLCNPLCVKKYIGSTKFIKNILDYAYNNNKDLSTWMPQTHILYDIINCLFHTEYNDNIEEFVAIIKSNENYILAKQYFPNLINKFFAHNYNHYYFKNVIVFTVIYILTFEEYGNDSVNLVTSDTTIDLAMKLYGYTNKFKYIFLYMISKGENMNNIDSLKIACEHLNFNFINYLENTIDLKGVLDSIVADVNTYKKYLNLDNSMVLHYYNMLEMYKNDIFKNDIFKTSVYEGSYLHKHYQIVSTNFLNNRDLPLIVGFNLESEDSDGHTLLDIAVMRKDYSRIILLLDNGANINRCAYYPYKNNKINTSLFSYMCYNLKVKDINEILIFSQKYNININIKNLDGTNALIMCLKNNKIEMAKVLIKNNIDLKDAKKYTNNKKILSLLGGNINNINYNKNIVSAPPEEGSSIECKICCLNKINIIAYPCKHALMCNNCYNNLCKINKKECQLCKQKISYVIDFIF